MTRHDPRDLFAADAVGMNACAYVVQAVTAGEQGRYSEQRALVAQAVEGFAKAISRLNPATMEQPESRARENG